MNKIRLRKAAMVLAGIMLILALSVGCTPKTESDEKPKSANNENIESTTNYPMDIKDQFGNEITIEKKPERIVSLAPSHTEILFSLGLGDKIVGVSSFCDYPEEAKTKEDIGSFQEINLERIIELEPDLVIQYGPGDEESNGRLKEAGINILCYEPETIDEVIELINTIGEVTDTSSEARKITKDMTDKKNSIVEKVKGAKKVKVFYEIWDDPLMVAGPGSFMDELMTLAGGDNIAKDAKGEYPQFDVEQLIERDPEVYLSAADIEEKTIESIKSRPGYENISAVKNDRIYLLEPNIVSRPGPRIVEGLEIVAKAIHPELFK
jgi:iron complex transport system substrate-binding protein